MQQDDQKSRTCGWVTTYRKDLSRSLREPFYTTNPLYVAQHKEWDWQECDYAEAERGVQRQMGDVPTSGDAA